MTKKTDVTPKKIGFLLGSLGPGGAEKTILTLAQHLAQKQCQVYLFLLNPSTQYHKIHNINVLHTSGKNEKEKADSVRNLSLKIGGLDVFICSRIKYYSAASAKKRLSTVHITPTAWLKKRPWYFLWKTKLQIRKLKQNFRDKQLIALSDGIKQDLIKNLQCLESNITVIHNPFDVKEINRLANADVPRITQGEYIIYVASLIKRKRHTDLIKSFSQIDNQEISLILLGQGEEENVLKNQVRNLNLSNRVIFHGWQKNPYFHIKNAALSVLVSEAEGLPRTLIESIIIGTTVISTDCRSGPNEILTGENERYLIPIGDTKALTQKINDVLKNRPKQKINVSHLDAKVVATQYSNLIDLK